MSRRARSIHSVVLMQQALESFVSWSGISRMLENRAAMLQEDLDKREQALKRLRELTLGQPEGAP
jgi:DNA-binding transcriptional MocR family regulator